KVIGLRVIPWRCWHPSHSHIYRGHLEPPVLTCELPKPHNEKPKLICGSKRLSAFPTPPSCSCTSTNHPTRPTPSDWASPSRYPCGTVIAAPFRLLPPQRMPRGSRSRNSKPRLPPRSTQPA